MPCLQTDEFGGMRCASVYDGSCSPWSRSRVALEIYHLHNAEGLHQWRFLRSKRCLRAFLGTDVEVSSQLHFRRCCTLSLTKITLVCGVLIPRFRPSPLAVATLSQNHLRASYEELDNVGTTWSRASSTMLSHNVLKLLPIVVKPRLCRKPYSFQSHKSACTVSL